MKREILLPEKLHEKLRHHLFQNHLEQAAFLFAKFEVTSESIIFRPVEVYLVPPQGWDVQLDVYLQMQDGERAKILKLARDMDLALIDCHSHPNSYEDVWFSPSDVHGITEFAAYVKWKLNGKPFVATVWGESSVDAVGWDSDFANANPVDLVRSETDNAWILRPTGSWFTKPKGKNRYDCGA